jgi:hypothetical protein
VVKATSGNRPIAFTWKQGGMLDVGLGTEDLEQVEPPLTFRSDNGEIEGVKYNRLSAVFINAIVKSWDREGPIHTLRMRCYGTKKEGMTLRIPQAAAVWLLPSAELACGTCPSIDAAA